MWVPKEEDVVVSLFCVSHVVLPVLLWHFQSEANGNSWHKCGKPGLVPGAGDTCT